MCPLTADIHGFGILLNVTSSIGPAEIDRILLKSSVFGQLYFTYPLDTIIVCTDLPDFI